MTESSQAERSSPPRTSDTERVVAMGAALVSAAIALGFAVGQAPGLSRFFTSAGFNTIPPTALVSLLLLSAAVGARRFSPRAEGLVVPGAVLAGGIATWAHIRNALNFTAVPDFDFLVQSAGSREAGQLSSLSPAVAGMIVGCAMGLVLLSPPLSRRTVCRAATAVISTLVTGYGLFLVVLALAGAGSILPPALRPHSTGLAIALTSVGVSLLANLGIFHRALSVLLGKEPVSLQNFPECGAERKRRRRFIAGLLVGSVLLGLLSTLLIRNTLKRERAKIGARMEEIVLAKANEISAWHWERLSDARTLMFNPGLSDLVNATNAPSVDGGIPSSLAVFLDELSRNYHYHEVAVFDRAGQLRYSTAGTATKLSGDHAPRWADLQTARAPLVEDVYRTPDGSIFIDLLSPLHSAVDGELSGAVLLRVDARRQLFLKLPEAAPLGKSSSIALLRPDGTDLVFISDSIFKQDSALVHRVPMSTTGLLSTKVLQAGPKGQSLVEALDYRGVDVLGVGRQVIGTPWIIVSQIDTAEALRPALIGATRVLVGVLLMLLSFGLAGGLAWHRRRQRWLESQLAAEAARTEIEHRLGVVMRAAKDAIVLFDADSQILEANESALVLYGRTLPEMQQLRTNDLRAPHTQSSISDDFSAAMTSDGVVFESVHQRRDGTQFPVEVSSRLVEIDRKRHVLSIIRDITQRKAQQREIETLNQLYRVISRINEAIVRHKQPRGLFEEVCRVMVEEGGFKLAWVGWRDEANDLLQPMAVAGDDHGYMTGIEVSAEAGLPQGMGPAGRALRENHPYVCNHLFSDPETMPWRERAARSGIQSLIALPIRQGAHLRALLAVFAAEKDMFGPREITLLQKCAEDLSFTLEAFANEERRKQAEAALQTSEARLCFLLSSTPAIIYSLRATGDFRANFVSPNVETILGHAPESFLQDAGFWDAHVHPEDSAVANESFADLIAGKQISREYRFRHRDGHYLWMRDEMRLIRDEQNQPREYVGYWLAITEAKRLTDELRSSEARHRALFENMDLGVLYLDDTATVTAANPAAIRILGGPANAMAGWASADSAWQPIREDGTRFAIDEQPGIVALRSGRRVLEVTMGMYTGAKRGYRWIQVDAVPEFRPGQEQPYQVFIVFADVTERRRAEAEVRKLSLVVEQSPISIIITDLTGAIEYVNPHFTTLTGYTFAEVRGRNPRFLKSGRTAPDLYDDLWRTITAGNVWRGEVVNRKKDGQFRDHRVVITPVNDQAGLPTHYVALTEDITDRKAADQNLRKLSRTLEQAPLSIAITNVAGEIEYVNPNFCATTGYSFAEVLGQNPRVLKSGETPAEVYQTMWQTLTRGEVWRGELSNKRKDGTIYIESAVIAPISDDHGTTTHYVALKENITERRRTEGALQQAREQYRLIAENTADAIWIYDLNHKRFTYNSPSVLKLRGVTPEEMAGLTLTDSLTPSSKERMETVLSERLAAFTAGDPNARTTSLEVELIHQEGHIVFAEIVTSFLTNAEGQPEALLGVTRDVTDRIEAEQEVRRSEELYRLIADNTSDAIWIYDFAQRKIIYVSPACERLIGYTPAQIIGQPLEYTLSPESADRVKSGLRQRLESLQGGDPSARTRTLLADYIHRDGRLVRGEIVSTVLTDSTGQPTQLLGITRDVTEREEAADRLRESRDRLAKAEQMVHLGNWECDLSTHLMSWSDEMYRIFDLDPHGPPVTMETFMDRVFQADRERVERAMREAVTHRTNLLVTHRVLSPGNRIKFVEASGECFYAADGTPLRAEGTVQDVTERKQTELELHEVVKQLRAMHGVAVALDQVDTTRADFLTKLAEHLPGALRNPQLAQAVVELDGDSREVGASGDRRHQLSSRIVINGDDRGKITLGYVGDQLLIADAPFTMQERETIESVARTIGLSLSAKESLRKLQRFNSELEERIQARTAELAARNREVQALLNAIPDMVLRLRTDGTVLSYQRSEDSAFLASISDADEKGLPAPLLAASLTLGRQALAISETVTAESELPSVEGNCSIELRAAPIGGDDFVVFVRDISRRKRMEAETAANLEKERQVSEMKSRFISVTSHEFRTPMAAAMGSVDILRRHLDRLAPLKREELFERIDHAMHRMTDMLDDVLTLSRVDAGRMKTELTAIHLPRFLETVVDEIRIGDKGAHRFEFELTADAASFLTDRNILHHIVSNLLSNAVRYSPADSTVTVRLQNGDGSLRLQVEDQGIGIPEADQCRIFEAFERASNVGTTKGTGLGLNIVKRMTEMLGGNVSVSSAPDRGSCFTVEFPFPSPAKS